MVNFLKEFHQRTRHTIMDIKNAFDNFGLSVKISVTWSERKNIAVCSNDNDNDNDNDYDHEIKKDMVEHVMTYLTPNEYAEMFGIYPYASKRR